MSDRRARLRAAAITLVLLVHGLAAAPLPHVVTRDDLKNPVSQEELHRWTERLNALGYTIDDAALAERVISITGVIGGAHRALIAPFRPLFRVTGTGQGWALFANPDTHPARLQIRVRRAGSTGWELLYQRLDPEHAWADDRLSYRRIRGCHDAGGFRSKPRAVYRRFADWIGREILAREPDVDVVEVRTVRTHTTVPPRPPDATEEPRHAITVRRPR
jgi:hypothetical protein